MSEYIYATDEHEGHWLTGEEIVRCRDCREYSPKLYRHISCELLGRYVEPDNFCAWAERRTDE